MTTTVTYRTLMRLRDNALRHHIAELDRLIHLLSISDRISQASEEFRRRHAALLAMSGQAGAIQHRNDRELFRQFCAAMQLRVRACMGDTSSGALPYRSPQELLDDLVALEAGLAEAGAGLVGHTEVSPLRCQVLMAVQALSWRNGDGDTRVARIQSCVYAPASQRRDRSASCTVKNIKK